jgi:hypothetical protein
MLVSPQREGIAVAHVYPLPFGGGFFCHETNITTIMAMMNKA